MKLSANGRIILGDKILYVIYKDKKGLKTINNMN